MARLDGVRRFFRIGRSAKAVSEAVDDEVHFHLETRADELRRLGWSAEDARGAAMREFGDMDAARRELVAMTRRRTGRGHRGDLFDGWRQDVRYAARALRRRPGFTAAVVATLALGIGANVAIFSVVDAALLRPLPYADADRLVSVYKSTKNHGGRRVLSYPDYLDWRARGRRVTVDLAGLQNSRLVLSLGDRSVVVSGVKATANLFDVLGVRPRLGRAFAEGEDAVGAPGVVLLTDGIWQREFGAAPDIVGRAITLDGRAFTVIGVLPSTFTFGIAGDAELWVPIDRTPAARANRGNHWMTVIARLRDGVSIDAARAELSAIANQIGRQYAGVDDGSAMAFSLREELLGSSRNLLLLAFGSVALVLLVACANVAHLLLVRAAARQRELGIRAALGAGRLRLARQLLTECLILAIAGGVAGIAVAHYGILALTSAIPAGIRMTMPYIASAVIDGRTLGYAAAVSLLAALIFGVAPALRAARPRLHELLKQGARGSAGGRQFGQDSLVVAELALTVMLVIGATLFARSLMNLLVVNPGFRGDRVLTVAVPLPRATYAEPERQRAFFDRFVADVRALPGVQAAGLISKLPFDPGNWLAFSVVGRPPRPTDNLFCAYRAVSEGYREALGIPLLAGRWITEQDLPGGPLSAVISQSIAKEVFPNENPIGRQLNANDFGVVTIVGVVGDVAIERLETPAPMAIYYSYRQAPESFMRIAVRTGSDPSALATPIRRIAQQIDHSVAVYQVQPMDDVVAQTPSVFVRRFPMLIVGAFAVTALVLAIIGVYGTISYAVGQRAREMGIRLALGARPVELFRLVITHAGLVVAVGLLLGVAGAAALSRTVASLLYGVEATDPATYATIGVLLGGVALLAAAVPARRAMRVDPLESLRAE